MIRFLISTVAYLAANAVGLLVAVLLLPGFVIDPLSFVIAVGIFSLVQTVLGPLITKISFKSFPQLMGGIALVTIFVGLLVTDMIMSSMEIGGISNWLAATLAGLARQPGRLDPAAALRLQATGRQGP